ncbi:E3 ubiquitin-protein ligase PPP1R11-like [Gorilla gorilla gorilla]|uniref:E3 ubiquitin-protein ligase PPP1R11-like n=1 Tax=Gorilla gorilla gorilla TaxID=9595 RepID=UPI002445B3F3|nr:E3 ubiquitin-protein ligase PPP1R11-like [Gorilla gorilla gorilla]
MATSRNYSLWSKKGRNPQFPELPNAFGLYRGDPQLKGKRLQHRLSDFGPQRQKKRRVCDTPSSFPPSLEAGAGLSETVTETTVTVTTEPENRSLTIKLPKRKPEKKVEWTSDTVDNERMRSRSSKCCSIYEKSRAFGESSTESDEEEEEGCGHTHCVRGHRKGWRPATLGPTPTTPPPPPDPSQPHAGPMQH